MKTKDIVYAGLFVTLISICAQIKISTPIVPFTLQPLAIFITSLTLGRKPAMLAITVYVLAGLIGLPVFAGGSGGLHILIRPTFGFIVGFIPMTYLCNRYKTKPLLAYSLSIASLYLIAMPYLFFNLTMIQSINISISSLLMNYCFLFLPTDSISFLLAAIISKRIS